MSVLYSAFDKVKVKVKDQTTRPGLHRTAQANLDNVTMIQYKTAVASRSYLQLIPLFWLDKLVRMNRNTKTNLQ